MPEANRDEIKYLTHQDHVRMRPGMYVGGKDRALYQLIYEVLDDSIESVVVGQCSQITLTLCQDNWVCVEDNSAGIPVEITANGRRFLELVMTLTYRRQTNGDYQITGGLFGVGVNDVNALAAECEVEVAREGYLWRQTYREGLPQTAVLQVRPLAADETTGTQIRFRPDFTILEPNEFQYDLLADRARELAFLLPGLTFTLRDERGTSPQAKVFAFPGGLADYAAYLNRGKRVIHAPITGSDEWTIQPKGRQAYKISVDVAFQYTNTMETTIIGYVNTVKTIGGLHMEVLPTTLLQAINRYAHGSNQQPFLLNEITPGLTAVVSVRHPAPQFESYPDVGLVNTDVYGIVAEVCYGSFYSSAWRENRRKENKRILQKCARNRRALQK